MGLEYRNCSSCTWTAAAEAAKPWMEMATESQADHLNICLTVWENIMHSSHLHTHNHFRSMLPSWKHALLISSYAVQRQWLHLFQVQINMSEALVKQLNYSKINIQLPFSIRSTIGLNMTERKGAPWRSSLPQKEQHWVHRASQTGKAPRTSLLTGPLPPSPPHWQVPTSATPELPPPLDSHEPA